MSCVWMTSLFMSGKTKLFPSSSILDSGIELAYDKTVFTQVIFTLNVFISKSEMQMFL